MSTTSFFAAIKEITSGKIAPIYFLAGPEKFFHDEIIRKLSEKIFPDPAAKDFGLSIFYGSENNISEVLNSALAYSMLAKHKLVIVRDFDKMKLGNAQSLEKYLQNPAESATLVLCSAEKGKTKIFKSIQKTALTVECKPIPEYQISEWVVGRCQQMGYEIDKMAAQFLADHIGSSLLNLDQEIAKIINYKNDDSKIVVDDIEQITGISKEDNVFALQNALSRREISNSFKIGARLIESGYNLPAINAILFAYFKKMLVVASLIGRGMNKRDIISESNLSNFQVNDLMRATQNFTIENIRQIVEILHQMDIAAKTSQIDDRPGVQLLCYKICRI